MKNLCLIACLSLLVWNSSAQKNDLPLNEYQELADPKPGDVSAWKTLDAKGPALHWSWTNTDDRYSKTTVPVVKKNNNWKASAWKGERVNAQALLWTTKPLEMVTIEAGDLKGPKGAVIPASAIETDFVRYVYTDIISKTGGGGCGHRPNKADWDSTLVADVIDCNKTLSVAQNTVQPVWATVWVPSDVPAGKYKGQMTLRADGEKPMTLNMEVDVLNRTLPAPKDWTLHLDLWQNPYSVARYNQVPLWSDAHLDAMRPVMTRLANAGQKVITATTMYKPWNGQTYDHFESMITRMKKIDGTWAFDYAIFDKWVSFMMSCGIDKQINCYTLVPWDLSFQYYDQATNSFKYVKAKPGDTAYEEYWGTFLTSFAKHLKDKGWFDKTTIAMDERPLDAMQKAIRVIKSADPDFKVSLAGNYHGEIEADIYDYCIAFGHNYPADIKAKREKEGKLSTYYTCCSEARPNTFTASPLAEASWIGWHIAAGNYDGYLRWAFNSWNADPLRDTRFISWAAGDCFMVYPNDRSSVRFERLIEGIQDYEKIIILRNEFTEKGEKAKLDQLNKAVAAFQLEGLVKDGAATMLNKARPVLNDF